MKKLKLLLWTLLSSFLVIMLSVEGWSFYRFVTQPISFTELETKPVLTIPEGRSAKQVANLLYQQKLLHHPTWFVWVLKYEGKSASLKAGEFEINPQWTVHELIDALVAGKTVQYPATLIAGKTVAQNMALLKSLNPQLKESNESLESVLKKQLNLTHLEGQFLPETYHYSREDSAVSLWVRAHQALQKTLEQTWDNCQEGLPIKTPQQLLILASIVEKESGDAAERPMIAAVFLNRLRKGMRLQSDPTIIYGMGDAFNGNIRKKDILALTPYNTYRINGLPPTPIALASRNALEAVCHPAETHALYFVAKGQGQHHFSETLIEHNQAVRTYQLSN
ncbi:endolytic transglycosylase MltG [Thiosulfativibrio zosterae]|uniref:Endolytic murein transglycosylase n=1 Tax=Thiosulfativibrio zosterae TaxID=2675053 RepID=A0A6F8PP04_9GAMM|nr:endolytic transglycosylase MltG [Thiosulfativibrio zosterae]BBP43806.1 aminodeoxychorismate lyase [Thiosulfativibrio zosterae]